MAFFSACFAAAEIAAALLAWPLLGDGTGSELAARPLTAALAAGLALLGGVGLACGFIQDSAARARQEAKRLHYLALPGLPEAEPATGPTHS